MKLTLQFDISALTSPLLKFDYAYATYSGEVDQMDVYYSTNNGSTYTLLLAMPGGTSGILNTGGTTTSSSCLLQASGDHKHLLYLQVQTK